MSKCPSPECNCPEKGSSAFNKAKVPSSILDKLNEKGLSDSYFEQCDYCDTVWVEKEELVQDKIIKYGTDLYRGLYQGYIMSVVINMYRHFATGSPLGKRNAFKIICPTIGQR